MRRRNAARQASVSQAAWVTEEAKKGQRDGAVDVAEQRRRATGDLEVGPGSLAECHPGGHQRLAGQLTTRKAVVWDASRTAAPAGAVGAQRVGEHVGVGSVVFVAGRAMAAAERFDLAARDHDDLQPSGQQRLNDRAVESLDRDLAHTEPDQAAGQPRNSLRCGAPPKQARTWPSGINTHTACSRDAQSQPGHREGMAASMVILSAEHPAGRGSTHRRYRTPWQEAH